MFSVTIVTADGCFQGRSNYVATSNTVKWGVKCLSVKPGRSTAVQVDGQGDEGTDEDYGHLRYANA